MAILAEALDKYDVDVHQAATIRNAAKLSVHVSGGYTEITVLRLDDYELVVLE